MSDFVGYIDREVVKGQLYRRAGCPVPTVFTGNIDTISDDLLVKAMYVVKQGDGSNGTFPNTTSMVFLITTIEYGSSTYLQSAISTDDAIEYRRIKAGSAAWTDWMSVNAEVDGIMQLITGTGGINSQISNINDDITTLNTTVYGPNGNNGLANTVSGFKSSIDSNTRAIDSLRNNINSITHYSQSEGDLPSCLNKTGGNSRIVKVDFYKNGRNCILSVRCDPTGSVSPNENLLIANLGPYTTTYKPEYPALGCGHYGQWPIIAKVNPTGDMYIRNTSGGTYSSGSTSFDVSISWLYTGA